MKQDELLPQGYRGYMTGRDKIVFVVAVLIASVLGTIGWPFFAIGMTMVVIAGVVWGLWKYAWDRPLPDPHRNTPRATKILDRVSGPDQIRGRSQIVNPRDPTGLNR